MTTAALSHLKVRHLRLLDLLAMHGTLRRAAVFLHVSQPAVTAMLNDIEALFGVALFTRSHQGVTLSGAGVELLGPVRTLLNEFEALDQRVGEARAGGSRTLRIGAVPHVFVWLLPKVAEQLREADNTALQVIDGHSPTLLDLLLAGKLDCVIGRVTPDWLLAEVSRQLDFERLYEEDMVFVAGSANPVLKKRRLCYRDLLTENWVLPTRASTTRRAFIEAFLRNGLTPPLPKVETGSFLYNLAVAGASSMLTIAPRTVTQQYQQHGLVIQLKLRLDATPLAVSLVTRKSSGADPTLGKFLNTVRQVVSQVMSPSNRAFEVLTPLRGHLRVEM